MAIATIDEIRLYLGKDAETEAVDVQLLQMLHPMVESLIRRKLHYDPEQATHTEFYPERSVPVNDHPLVDFEDPGFNSGDEAYLIQLRHIPVRSITYVKVNGTTLSSASYEIDSLESEVCKTGWLRRIDGGGWPQDARDVEVQYVGGWTAAEIASEVPELKLAVMTGMAKAFNEAKAQQGGLGSGGLYKGPVVEESLDTWKIKYDGEVMAKTTGLQQALPEEVDRLLEHLVNYGVAV